MDFTKAVAIVIAGIFSRTLAHSFMIVAWISGLIVTCWTFSNLPMTTSPPRSIMPKIGGFSVARLPRPRLPLSRHRRPERPFLQPHRAAFVPGHDVDLIAFHLTAQGGGGFLSHEALAQLSRHVMRIVFVEVEFLGNWRIGQVEAHEGRAQNPDAQRLMMTSKDRVSQLVKAPFTRLAQIALRLGLSVVALLFGDLWTVAIGAPVAIGPAPIADGGEPFGVVY